MGIFLYCYGGTQTQNCFAFTVNGQVIATRDNNTTITYLHSDHLGSVSLATTNDGSGPVVASEQLFTPWGAVRTGGIGQTTTNYTGQRLDGSGLLYYHARYYDPALARFISADSVVPGSASGSMDGVALKPLTVDFHEPGFATTLAGENAQPFRFQLSGDQRQQAGYAGGPLNPQALNRYAYVQNNPVHGADPSGHVIALTRKEAVLYQTTVLAPLRSALTNLDRKATLTVLMGGMAAGGIVASMTASIATMLGVTVLDGVINLRDAIDFTGAKAALIAVNYLYEAIQLFANNTRFDSTSKMWIDLIEIVRPADGESSFGSYSSYYINARFMSDYDGRIHNPLGNAQIAPWVYKSLVGTIGTSKIIYGRINNTRRVVETGP